MSNNDYIWHFYISQLNYIYPFNLGGWNNIKGDLGYAKRTLDEFDLFEVRRNGQGLVYYSRLEIELSNRD